MAPYLALVDLIARFLLLLLPRRISRRVKENASDITVTVLSAGEIKTKPRMTLMEAVGATLLFDLALFGTDNRWIRGILRLFTRLQNTWDTPFASPHQARGSITDFCQRLGIATEPWIWDQPLQNYHCLNDFFSRTYATEHFPPLGDADLVSPACCTLRCYDSNRALKCLLIKGCDYELDQIGIPDAALYANNHVLIGYLSPCDYHRVHAPVSGKVVYQELCSTGQPSASVKFWEGKFNILNENQRLVVVIETQNRSKVALVVVGGVGVDTIVYRPDLRNQTIAKGDHIATFRAGGSAIAVLTTKSVQYRQDFLAYCNQHSGQVEVMVGESLGNF
jgi:phosphatidylserine decarboxylase